MAKPIKFLTSQGQRSAFALLIVVLCLEVTLPTHALIEVAHARDQATIERRTFFQRQKATVKTLFAPDLESERTARYGGLPTEAIENLDIRQRSKIEHIGERALRAARIYTAWRRSFQGRLSPEGNAERSLALPESFFETLREIQTEIRDFKDYTFYRAGIRLPKGFTGAPNSSSSRVSLFQDIVSFLDFLQYHRSKGETSADSVVDKTTRPIALLAAIYGRVNIHFRHFLHELESHGLIQNRHRCLDLQGGIDMAKFWEILGSEVAPGMQDALRRARQTIITEQGETPAFPEARQEYMLRRAAQGLYANRHQWNEIVRMSQGTRRLQVDPQSPAVQVAEDFYGEVRGAYKKPASAPIHDMQLEMMRESVTVMEGLRTYGRTATTTAKWLVGLSSAKSVADVLAESGHYTTERFHYEIIRGHASLYAGIQFTICFLIANKIAGIWEEDARDLYQHFEGIAKKIGFALTLHGFFITHRTVNRHWSRAVGSFAERFPNNYFVRKLLGTWADYSAAMQYNGTLRGQTPKASFVYADFDEVMGRPFGGKAKPSRPTYGPANANGNGTRPSPPPASSAGEATPPSSSSTRPTPPEGVYVDPNAPRPSGMMRDAAGRWVPYAEPPVHQTRSLPAPGEGRALVATPRGVAVDEVEDILGGVRRHTLPPHASPTGKLIRVNWRMTLRAGLEQGIKGIGAPLGLTIALFESLLMIGMHPNSGAVFYLTRCGFIAEAAYLAKTIFIETSGNWAFVVRIGLTTAIFATVSTLSNLFFSWGAARVGLSAAPGWGHAVGLIAALVVQITYSHRAFIPYQANNHLKTMINEARDRLEDTLRDLKRGALIEELSQSLAELNLQDVFDTDEKKLELIQSFISGDFAAHISLAVASTDDAVRARDEALEMLRTRLLKDEDGKTPMTEEEELQLLEALDAANPVFLQGDGIGVIQLLYDQHIGFHLAWRSRQYAMFCNSYVLARRKWGPIVRASYAHGFLKSCPDDNPGESIVEYPNNLEGMNRFIERITAYQADVMLLAQVMAAYREHLSTAKLLEYESDMVKETANIKQYWYQYTEKVFSGVEDEFTFIALVDYVYFGGGDGTIADSYPEVVAMLRNEFPGTFTPEREESLFSSGEGNHPEQLEPTYTPTSSLAQPFSPSLLISPDPLQRYLAGSKSQPFPASSYAFSREGIDPPENAEIFEFNVNDMFQQLAYEPIALLEGRVEIHPAMDLLMRKPPGYLTALYQPLQELGGRTPASDLKEAAFTATAVINSYRESVELATALDRYLERIIPELPKLERGYDSDDSAYRDELVQFDIATFEEAPDFASVNHIDSWRMETSRSISERIGRQLIDPTDDQHRTPSSVYNLGQLGVVKTEFDPEITISANALHELFGASPATTWSTLLTAEMAYFTDLAQETFFSDTVVLNRDDDSEDQFSIVDIYHWLVADLRGRFYDSYFSSLNYEYMISELSDYEFDQGPDASIEAGSIPAGSGQEFTLSQLDQLIARIDELDPEGKSDLLARKKRSYEISRESIEIYQRRFQATQGDSDD